MTSAAIIYLLSALAIVAFDIRGVVLGGVSLAALIWALVALAFAMQSRGLFQGRRQARIAAIISSLAIVIAACISIYWYVTASLPAALKFGARQTFWLLVCIPATVALAHALALLLLFRARPGPGLG
jgi:hypothetical protein